MEPEIAVSTVVNGLPVTDTVPTRLRLVEFLRERLGLTGTKESCTAQVCGSCTVLVDGRPVSSCTQLAADVDGRTVQTVEGLQTGADLSPVQQAFVACTAMQCGYCTPGFVMAVTALLAENADPTDEEIDHYLEGNLCRCTGYLAIVEAVHHAARLR